mmetsp:Transcript_126186/g.362956  ORF Transcript_126186/g.362956 Transcript_126186/m.362956 type:complete len:310 (-) Transcript_126186:358-1287(-)
MHGNLDVPMVPHGGSMVCADLDVDPGAASYPNVFMAAVAGGERRGRHRRIADRSARVLQILAVNHMRKGRIIDTPRLRRRGIRHCLGVHCVFDPTSRHRAILPILAQDVGVATQFASVGRGSLVHKPVRAEGVPQALDDEASEFFEHADLALLEALSADGNKVLVRIDVAVQACGAIGVPARSCAEGTAGPHLLVQGAEAALLAQGLTRFELRHEGQLRQAAATARKACLRIFEDYEIVARQERPLGPVLRPALQLPWHSMCRPRLRRFGGGVAGKALARYISTPVRDICTKSRTSKRSVVFEKGGVVA